MYEASSRTATLMFQSLQVTYDSGSPPLSENSLSYGAYISKGSSGKCRKLEESISSIHCK